MSVNTTGSLTDLYDRDDKSGRQRWIIQLSPDGQLYNILVENGITTGLSYLSTTTDGSKVDLYSRDDGTGRQRWIIEPVPQSNNFHIKIRGGVNNSRKYLSTTADGSKVDLYHIDDKSGRQLWQFIPLTGKQSSLLNPIVQTTDPRVVGILDPVFYLIKYPDVKEKFGNNSQAALNHWVRFGIAECRQSSANFDIKYYLDSYPDLVKEFGTNCAKSLDHWLNIGKKEGRKTSGLRIQFTNKTDKMIEIYQVIGEKEFITQNLSGNNSVIVFQPKGGPQMDWRLKVIGNTIYTHHPTTASTQAIEISATYRKIESRNWTQKEAAETCNEFAKVEPGGWTGGLIKHDRNIFECEIAIITDIVK